MVNFILIDGSYYVFFRFYACVSWWKLAYGVETMGVLHDNEEFVEKFKQLFVSKLKEIPKKLKQKDAKVIAFKDCPRNQIWRYQNFDEYKANRCIESNLVSDDDEQIVIDPGPFFKLVYREKLFEQAGIDLIKGANLEADDCVAITTKYLTMLNKNNNITIISSDNDYVQLLESNVKLFNLKYKQIGVDVKDPKLELFVKCISGDKSDNIPSVFPRCGRKKAITMYYDSSLFDKMCEKHENSKENFLKNKRLIDFNKIPKKLIVNFFKDTLKPYINNISY